jgi:hypothetical protein
VIVRVLASPEAVRFVREHGGAVFVWVESLRSQGSVRYVEASTESPGPERWFTRLVGGDFELFLDTGGLQVPDRLEIDLRGRRRKRLRVSWNGATFASDPRPTGQGPPATSDDGRGPTRRR